MLVGDRVWINGPIGGCVVGVGVGDRLGLLHLELQVGQDGSYSVDVPPGTYTVVGYSPTALSGNQQMDCPANGVAEVTSGATTTADPICSIK